MTVHAGYDAIGDKCLGHVQPGTRALSEAMLAKWGGTSDGIYNCRNVRGGHTKSAHAEGRAYDHHWTNQTTGQQIANALVALNDKLGIQVVIFWDRIWSATKGWHDYTGTDPHHAHIHVEQNWSGATELTLPEANRVLNPSQEDDLNTEQDTLLRETHARVKNLEAVADRDINTLGPKIAEVLQAVKDNPNHGSGAGDVDPDEAAKAVVDLLAEKLGK